jgi:hypothetical protein
MRWHTLLGLWFAVFSAVNLWLGLRDGGKFMARWPMDPIGQDQSFAYAVNAVMWSFFMGCGLMMMAHDLWGWWFFV